MIIVQNMVILMQKENYGINGYPDVKLFVKNVMKVINWIMEHVYKLSKYQQIIA